MTQTLRTLIFKESEAETQSLISHLEKWGYNVIYERVATFFAMKQALEKLPEWDLLLADNSLPEFSTQDTVNLLKQKAIDLSFLILSGKVSDISDVFLMKYGVNSYMVKGELNRLDVVLEQELKEVNLRKRHKKLVNDLGYLVYYQPLTGLANQTLFIKLLEEEIKKQQQNKLFGVLYIDLDRFETVKYSFGYECSNQLIVATVERLRKTIHTRHTIGHLNNDQFVVLLRDLEHTQEAVAIANLIHQIISCPFNLEGVNLATTASIGIAFSNISYQKPEEFLQAADNAMNHAKKLGRGQTVIFEKYMIAFAQERLKLETELLQGINKQEFCLHYQPIVNINTGQLSGFEALVRWQNPIRGLIAPTKFIPIAEETGLIIGLSEWIISEGCKRLGMWQKMFPQLQLQLSINLSSAQLSSIYIIDILERAMNLYDLQDNSLKIEITETVLIENYTLTSTILTELKKRNIQIAIDDFGTGYSCLNYLNSLPIDTLKIDRSFINTNLTEARNIALVKSIVALAHNLGLNMVAEGIETKEEEKLLSSLNCEYGQGYYYSRPLDTQTAEGLLRYLNSNNPQSQNLNRSVELSHPLTR